MKKLIKLVLPTLLLAFYFSACPVAAVSLSDSEVRLMNGLAAFIDRKPEGQALRLIESAMKSQNPALRGMAAIILFKHYGENFRARLLRNFTLNSAKDSFVTEKAVFVRIENISPLLATYDKFLKNFNDERTRQLFLFYHFRHKQVYMLGESGEHLSMAAFYRIGLFEKVLGRQHDAIALAATADR